MNLKDVRRSSVWLFLIAFVTVAGSCSSETVSPEPSEPPPAVQSVFVAVAPEVESEPGISLFASLSGVIDVVDGCLYVTYEGAADRILPVFPAGSAKWEDGALIVEDERYEDGDSIRLGGGEMPVTAEDTWRQTFDVPPDCSIPSVWTVSKVITTTEGDTE